MIAVADTNVLVRVLTDDDPQQSDAAKSFLRACESVHVPDIVLCELVWVLRRGYRYPAGDVARAIEGLMNAANVVMHASAARAGLAALAAGGDFADGVIAHQGYAHGAHVFATFDKRAAEALTAQGKPVRLL